MSMSTHLVGFIPPDEQFRKNRAAYVACKEAGISIPDELISYFNEQPPDSSGVRIDLKIEHQGSTLGYARKCCSDSWQGIEVELDKLPKHIKILRFFNSY